MKKGKRVFTLLLALVTIIMMMAGPVGDCFSLKAKAAVGTTFVVHYGGRSDNDYNSWNMWIWEEGHDGTAVDFTADDAFGRIAVYQCTYDTDRIGFIVRKGEWEAKDVEADRYADITGDVVEIWVTSEQEEFSYEAPEGCEPYDSAAAEEARLGAYDLEDSLKINVHYYTYSGSYDKVTAYAALGDAPGGSYPLIEKDDFGGLYHVGFEDYEKEDYVSLYMMNDGSADTDSTRQLDISRAVDGVLDVYTVQGNTQVWYDEEEADLTPIIVSAEFEDGTKHIKIKVSKAVNTSKSALEGSYYTVTDQSGTSYAVTKVTGTEENGMTTEALVIMDDELDADNTYYIEREGYKGCEVGMAGAFSSDSFEASYTYEGDDLGMVYGKDATQFRLWAPTATQVKINFYEAGDGDCLKDTVSMEKDAQGTWIYTAEGDMNGVYYTYLITVGEETNEVVDPYARACGVNGDRAMVIDLSLTDPEGWDKDDHVTVTNQTDAIIYETHIRDLTIDASSGSSYPGKYLGVSERGTKSESGAATGLDHILELGANYVQIMPMYDYATVDETDSDNAYNWGYDPKNYNVPEGSYSSDPYNGEVRVNEVKQMVKGLHDSGVGVIMDVVYNHMYSAEASCLNNAVPGYYFRMDGDSYYNGSGCGNELASERSMVRKYIVDSVVYWATEYHIDGFRFDLMGCIDQETMEAIRAALDEIDPSIIIIGEGWTGGTSGLPSYNQTLKASMYKIDSDIAAFSDDIRDGLKGNVFDDDDTGFIQSKGDLQSKLGIMYSVVAATQNDAIDYDSYEKTSSGYWASAPTQCVNYVSCHDNLTLWDKLYYSAPDADEDEKVAMNKLAAAINYTCQGMEFMLSGEEMLRSKPITDESGNVTGYSSNSYNLDDSTNSMKWDSLDDEKVSDVYEYYKGLIAFRKAHPALRMTTTEEVQENITFVDTSDDNSLIAYTIDNSPNGEEAESIMVIYNGNKEAASMDLPEGDWNVYINGQQAGTEIIETVNTNVNVAATSAMVLVKEKAKASTGSRAAKGVAAGVAAVAAISLAALALTRKKNK